MSQFVMVRCLDLRRLRLESVKPGQPPPTMIGMMQRQRGPRHEDDVDVGEEDEDD